MYLFQQISDHLKGFWSFKRLQIAHLLSHCLAAALHHTLQLWLQGAPLHSPGHIPAQIDPKLPAHLTCRVWTTNETVYSSQASTAFQPSEPPASPSCQQEVTMSYSYTLLSCPSFLYWTLQPWVWTALKNVLLIIV